jgi:MinD-like ATPase involved in chromosome partitioning or flagellar assembly
VEGTGIIAVASAAGSPGRTTVALGLAAALGAVAPAVLVDADLAGASLAAYLDADPSRNLFMLAHAAPQSPGEWDRALGQELQPLDPGSPHGAVLCGVPTPLHSAGVAPAFFARAVAEVRARYRYVIIDVGADLVGAEAVVHRAALGLAGQVLLVASPDVVGLSRLRVTRRILQEQLGLPDERIALVINRHDRRQHHDRDEIAWALGTPLAAVIPADGRSLQRALAAQRPVVFDPRSRAGRALVELAERVHAGRITLPTHPATTPSRQETARGRRPWRRWLFGRAEPEARVAVHMPMNRPEGGSDGSPGKNRCR